MTYDSSTMKIKTLGLWTKTATANMGLAKAGIQSELQPFVLLINFGAVRQ